MSSTVSRRTITDEETAGIFRDQQYDRMRGAVELTTGESETWLGFQDGLDVPKPRASRFRSTVIQRQFF